MERIGSFVVYSFVVYLLAHVTVPRGATENGVRLDLKTISGSYPIFGGMETHLLHWEYSIIIRGTDHRDPSNGLHHLFIGRARSHRILHEMDSER